MIKRFILAAVVALTATSASFAAGTGWTTASVHFRDGPGAYYASLGTLSRCAKLGLDYVENGWYRVQWNGQWGWVSQRYITASADYCANYHAPSGGYGKPSGSYGKSSY